MRKLRDVVYINGNLDKNHILYYGVEFKEFVNSLVEPLKNVLLIKHNFYGDNFHSMTRFEYVKSENLCKLLDEDVSGYGDFCWVDFQDISSLDLLEPKEIAELLYFGHTGLTLDSYFLDKLKNRFAYRSHDDGWHNEIHCRDINDFLKVITDTIEKRAVTSKRRKVNTIPNDIATELLHLSTNGLLIDFNNVVGHNSIEVPIYVIGKINNMDDMYNNLDRYKGKAQSKVWLVYKNKNWRFEKY